MQSLEKFSLWLDSLSWGPALCFCLAVSVGLCVIILLFDAWRNPEQSDIRQMLKAGRKPMSDDLLISPLNDVRQPSFKLPNSMRDFKDRK